ncbi:hypothetical protein ACFU0X_10490 [Streptomyces cellulosae]|uniref:Uncharacterized protein n=1 Tax=Streptomyces cellulosae TaxID=1968 RepID=A0ABW6JDP3_STRCE
MRKVPVEVQFAPDFARLKAVSDTYRARRQELDDAAERMRNEAIRLTRKGWRESRPKQTARVAATTRWTHQYVARLAGEGWDRTLNGTVEAAGEEDFSALSELSAQVLNLTARCDRLEGVVRAEAVRLAREGKRLRRYGQVAAVARVTGWTREHVDRLAKAPDSAGRAGGRGLPDSKSAA